DFSDIVKASALVEPDIDQLPDQRFIAGEMDEKIVAHASCHEIFVMIIPALYEDFLNSSLMDCADLSGDLLYFSQKTIETVFYYVLRNLIFHHGGGGSAPLGVDKSKRAVIAHLSHHIQRLLEVFLSLSRESYDDVRRE